MQTLRILCILLYKRKSAIIYMAEYPLEVVIILGLLVIGGLIAALILLAQSGAIPGITQAFCDSFPALCGNGTTLPTENFEIAKQGGSSAASAVNRVGEGGAGDINENIWIAVCLERGWEYCRSGTACESGYERRDDKMCCEKGHCKSGGSLSGGIISYSGDDEGRIIDESITNVGKTTKTAFGEVTEECETMYGYAHIEYEEDNLWDDENVWYRYFIGSGWDFAVPEISGYEEYKSVSDMNNNILSQVETVHSDIAAGLKGKKYEDGLAFLASVLNDDTDSSGDDTSDDYIKLHIVGTSDPKMIYADDYEVFCIDDKVPESQNLKAIRYDMNEWGGYDDGNTVIYYAFKNGKWKWSTSLEGEYLDLEKFSGTAEEARSSPAFRYLRDQLIYVRSDYKKGLNVFEKTLSKNAGGMHDDRLWVIKSDGTRIPDDDNGMEDIYCLNEMADFKTKAKCTLRDWSMPQETTDWEEWLVFFGNPDLLYYWQVFPVEEDTWTYKPGLFTYTAIIALSAIPFGKGAGKLAKKIATQAGKEAIGDMTIRGILTATKELIKQQSIKLIAERIAWKAINPVTYLKLIVRTPGRIKNIGKFLLKEIPAASAAGAAVVAEFSDAKLETMMKRLEPHGNAMVLYSPYVQPKIWQLTDKMMGRPVMLQFKPGAVFMKQAPAHLASPCEIESIGIEGKNMQCESYSYNTLTKVTTCEETTFEDMGDDYPMCEFDIAGVSEGVMKSNPPVRTLNDLKGMSVESVMQKIRDGTNYEVTAYDAGEDEVALDSGDVYKVKIEYGKSDSQNVYIVDSNADGYFDTFGTEGDCYVSGVAFVNKEEKETDDKENYCVFEQQIKSIALEWLGYTLTAVSIAMTPFCPVIAVVGVGILAGGAEAASMEFGQWPKSR